MNDFIAIPWTWKQKFLELKWFADHARIYSLQFYPLTRLTPSATASEFR